MEIGQMMRRYEREVRVIVVIAKMVVVSQNMTRKV